MHRFTDADLYFLASTVSADPQRAGDLRSDDLWLDHVLDDERLLRRLRDDTEAIAQISPWLLFTVLLRRVRRELQAASYTIEELGGERVAVFDARRAGALLDDPQVQDYLIELLVSFTRTSSFVLDVEEQGTRRRRRFSDSSSEDMIALAALLPDDLRFPFLRRIADIALFVTGVFPDSLIAPTGISRRDVRSLGWPGARTMEEYEEEGRHFYRLASEHLVARRTGMTELLATLADAFPLARKPLNFLASQYIGTTQRSTAFRCPQ